MQTIKKQNDHQTSDPSNDRQTKHKQNDSWNYKEWQKYYDSMSRGETVLLASVFTVVATIGAVLSSMELSPITRAILNASGFILGYGLNAYVLFLPLLMGKHIGVHPIQIVLGFIIGSKFGFTGLLLTIPFCVITNALIATSIRNKAIKKDIQE